MTLNYIKIQNTVTKWPLIGWICPPPVSPYGRNNAASTLCYFIYHIYLSVFVRETFVFSSFLHIDDLFGFCQSYHFLRKWCMKNEMHGHTQIINNQMLLLQEEYEIGTTLIVCCFWRVSCTAWREEKLT